MSLPGSSRTLGLRGRWMEAVPNFSEGRDEAKVALLAEAAQAAGAVLIDVHTDRDHNRSVLTLAQEPAVLAEAVFRVIERAAQVLDITRHWGVHPRIGVADVVPFVPVSGVTMQDCVDVARSVGRTVGEQLGLPVYMYENAAYRAEYMNLADIRRLYGAYLESEAGARIPTPDFGPVSPHPTAGSVVIGARAPLIAFNCFIHPADHAAARRIAARTRQTGGGPPGVKALGFWLAEAGRAQVSMNITDVVAAPPHVVVEHVDREARAEDCVVTESELVGLVPLNSVLRAAAGALKLPTLKPGQVLELAILEKSARLTLDEFLTELAGDSPAPGGGAASALTGALAAALGSMVLNFTVGRKKFAQVEDRARTALSRLEAARGRLAAFMHADAEAYTDLTSRYKMPKGTPAEREARDRAVEDALRRAAEVPLACAAACVEVLDLLAEIVDISNPNLASDTGSAAILAEAAVRSALLNVRTNAGLMKDRVAAEAYLRRMLEVEERAQLTARDVLGRAVARMVSSGT